MSEHTATDSRVLSLPFDALHGPVHGLKRPFDILVAAVLVLLLLPAFLLLAVLICCDTPGAPIFRQERVGRGGRSFRCLKFRTMHPDAEFVLENWHIAHPELLARYIAGNFKLTDDPRVTRVGRWLRRTSLDELPQLLNVLAGSMSLVGPRPLLAREVASYGPPIAVYLKVRPGLTGLWQVSGRSNTSFQARVAFDVDYARTWSFRTDIALLWRTARMLFGPDSGAF